jgi:HSP90 family molecular chaperone
VPTQLRPASYSLDCMRFQANDRILDLLVGSNLYPEPEACVRELLQNAWDAVQWLSAETGTPRESGHRVRSAHGTAGFEISDNGVGMNTADIESSLLQIGQDKLKALQAAGQRAEQVAYLE